MAQRNVVVGRRHVRTMTSPDSPYAYGETFLKYTSDASFGSAKIIAPLVYNWLPVTSVIDFGCAQGAWFAAWRTLGADDILGVDGAYVDIDQLMIPRHAFKGINLSEPLDLGRKVDLVQSLEVGEHIPAALARQFVSNLTAHGEIILFSAAPPGQGGEHHVNEQPYEYWRQLFQEHGYEMYDPIRTLIKDNPDIQYWYRFNIFIFASKEVAATLPDQILCTHLPVGSAIPDISPPVFKFRKAIVRCLPTVLRNRIAQAKAKLTVRRAGP